MTNNVTNKVTNKGLPLSHRWVAGFLGTAVKAVLAGTAAAGVVLAHASMASAAPEPSTQQEPAEDPQEQEEQQQGIPIPRPNPSNNNGNPSNNSGSKPGDLADKNCWMYSTGPEWFAPGAMPRPGAPGEKVWPCYYVAGLTPH